MTKEMKMVFEMAHAFSEISEKEFLANVFDKTEGVEVSCADAVILSKMDGAIDDEDICVIYWKDMVIGYDPWGDWPAEEI